MHETGLAGTGFRQSIIFGETASGLESAVHLKHRSIEINAYIYGALVSVCYP